MLPGFSALSVFLFGADLHVKSNKHAHTFLKVSETLETERKSYFVATVQRLVNAIIFSA